MLVVCTGTGTDVGKTWVGAAVLGRLQRAGRPVTARKPVQSFDPGSPGPTDAEVLAAATGQVEHDVCPEHRWYPVSMAPPMAAAVLGRAPIAVADLVTEARLGDVGGPGLVWVETAGGVRSPIADDADTVTLCQLLAPDLVVVVAHSGLGTINDVRLTVGALAGWAVVVVLNRYDPACDLHVRNRTWLAEREGIPVVTDPTDLVL